MTSGAPVPPLVTARTDQVGSLLRPPALKQAYVDHEAGRLDAAGVLAAQDEAVRRVVADQEAHGVSVVTDGEFRRINFQDGFAASVSGYAASANTAGFNEARVAGAAPLQRWDPGYSGAGPAVVHRRPVIDRLRLECNLLLEEYAFTSALTPRPVKVTLVGPDRVVARFDHAGSTDVYPTVEEFRHDVVRVGRQMITEVVAAGCPYVQVDEPGYTAYVDEPSLAELRAEGFDPAERMAESIAADNALIAAFPEVTFGVHLCRGNQRSMWHREGTYDAIAEELFSQLDHQRLLLEYDSERAGGFAPLRFVPPGKVVVLGLVSTKTAEIESADGLRRRIDEAATYLPLDQLALSPQCGFSSDLAGNVLSEDDQWRKLDLVRTVAADVWGAP